MSAPLMLVSIGTSAGRVLLGAAVAVGLGTVIVTATVSAVLVLSHAEDWRSYCLSQQARRAARDRRAATDLAARDESAADAALASWVSLVVEECQLAPSDAVGGEDWLTQCVAVATRIARVGADSEQISTERLADSGQGGDLGRSA